MSHVSVSNAILFVLLGCSLGLRDDDQHAIELGVSHFHKDQASRLKPQMEQLASSEPATEVQGDIHDALLAVKAQLEGELKEQEQKKVNAQDAIQGIQRDLAAAQAVVDKWNCHYFGWAMDFIWEQYCTKMREEQVPLLRQQERAASEEIQVIDAEIRRLKDGAQNTLTVAEAAKLEEDLIESLGREENSLQERKKASLSANREMEVAEKEKNDKKIAAFDKELASLSETLESTEQTHALLTEEHTGGSCEAKEAKGERTCERCAENQKACGDTCISAEQHCWYDEGCACMEEAGGVSNAAGGSRSAAGHGGLLQVASETGQGHAHPLQVKLDEARAQLQKIIHAQDGKIENLKAQLATSNSDIQKTENAKQAADRNSEEAAAEITQQRNTLARLTAEQREAEAKLAQHKATLETTTQEGEQAIEKMVGELARTILELKSGLVKTETEKTSTMEANAAAMKVLKDKNAAQINDIDAEIQKVLTSKDEAQKKLNVIKASHGLDAMPDA